MKHGFFRVAACAPSVAVADVKANTAHIIDMIREAEVAGADLAVFPELCVTAYTCGDLFHNDTLSQAAEKALEEIAGATRGLHVAAVIGIPLRRGCMLLNCGALVVDGRCPLIRPKQYIPNYNEFYEKRLWRTGHGLPEERVKLPGFDEPTLVSTTALAGISGVKVGIEVCEDLWVPIPPSSFQTIAGAEIVANLSASNDLIGKHSYLRRLIAQQSARCVCGYVYASAGFGESSTDLVFDGKGFIAENGAMLAETGRWRNDPQIIVRDIDIEALRHDRLHQGTFSDCARRLRPTPAETIDATPSKAAAEDWKLARDLNPRPFVPSTDTEIDSRSAEIVDIQAAGLAQRLNATNTKRLVIGISGGLDSTLALLVAARAFDRLGLDREGIVGVTMPGFGTSGRTRSNALTLMKALGVESREIPIAKAVEQHFSDIGHDPDSCDATYENSQARERTQILMDLANELGGMVLGTGDLSELALGWATYNGDHMSMYGVNASIPKTLAGHLVRWFAGHTDSEEMRRALLDIVDTPISPELLPADASGDIAQKTEDLVGPYELHDFFLYYMLRYGFSPKRIYLLACKAFPERPAKEIIYWLRAFCRRFFSQQFKRSCLPDGPKVGSVSLSPRGDWRMPSDASAALWLAECDDISATLPND